MNQNFIFFLKPEHKFTSLNVLTLDNKQQMKQKQVHNAPLEITIGTRRGGK